MYPPLSGKPWTGAKCPLHTDLVILWLRQRACPNKLFAPKGNRTLDLMECHQNQGLYHLSQLLGVKRKK